jgi:hypothetical protein
LADSDRHRDPFVVGVRNAGRQLADDARAAAAAAGYPDLSSWTVSSWRWLARYPGASEPHRPEDPGVIARQLLRQAAAAIDTLAATDPGAAAQLADDIAELGRRVPGTAAT